MRRLERRCKQQREGGVRMHCYSSNSTTSAKLGAHSSISLTKEAGNERAKLQSYMTSLRPPQPKFCFSISIRSLLLPATTFKLQFPRLNGSWWCRAPQRLDDWKVTTATMGSTPSTYSCVYGFGRDVSARSELSDESVSGLSLQFFQKNCAYALHFEVP